MLIEYLSHGYPTGYGEAGRRLVRALVDLGVAVRWTPIEFDARCPLMPDGRASLLPDLEPLRGGRGRPDVIVLHAIPELLPAVRQWAGRTPVVLHTVWEANELQPHWPALLNQSATVIVPTDWNVRSFRAAGVRVPIAAVPYAISTADPDDGWLESEGDAFVVGSIAAWTARKAPWLTVEAFARAFGPADDATLVLRTDSRLEHSLPTPPGPPDRARLSSWTVASILHRHAPTGRVRLVHDLRTAGELAALHRRSDCWLALPRAEGWDLGTFDAAVAATPVVTTGVGGQLDYLDQARFAAGPPIAASGVPGVMWTSPDIDAAVRGLREVHAASGAARRAAAAQADRLRRRCAPPAIAREFIAALPVR